MSTYDKVKYYTSLFEPEIDFLINAIKNAPKGNVIVAGTYKGGDVMAMMLEDQSREYYVVDSFEGLAKPVEQDIAIIEEEAKHTMKEGEFSCGGHDKYLENFKEINLSPPNTYPMFIDNEKLKQVNPGDVAVIWLDLDHYAPTKSCLEYFDKYLVDGAIIACHDYGFIRCPGIKRACDEYSNKWKHGAGGIFTMKKE